MKRIIISHKRNDCIGCGSCALLAPKNWKMNDDDGKSDLVGGDLKKNGIVVAAIDEADLKDNTYAAEACPVNIIKLN
ncbi:MAG: ferredoxin [Candidatus Pacebacteria bacterium]|nr:ferredoxin [Candidatus Paceibacterota bacterium]MCF7857599.1 ferredoxin [Candidatus Paceibacterota bacterium]